MHQSKLITLIKTFATKDLRLFGEFVRSPFFNKNAELIRFFEAIKPFHPSFESKKLSREHLWKTLYPDRPLSDKELNYLLNFLLKLVEKYIGLCRYQADPFMPEFHILEAYTDRGLEKHYHYKHRQLKKRLNDPTYQNERNFYDQYELSALDARFAHLKQQRTLDDHLQATIGHLDHYYLAAKLRMTCELVNRQNILSADYEGEQVEALFHALQQNPAALELPAISLYYNLLLLLVEPEKEAHWQRFKDLLSLYASLFPPLELKELYSNAQNHCIRRIREGKNEYLKELFEIYGRALKTGALLEADGFLSPWKYKNIVSVGLRLGEVKWAEQMIQEYLAMLPPEFRESAAAYNQAHVCYHRGDYKTALRLLQEVEFSDVYYSLDTRKMMLRIYFEQEDTEPLRSLVAAFKLFLKRNKLISENNRMAYRNFVDWVYKLTRMREKGKKTGQKIREEILATHPLVDEEWLLQWGEI